MNEAEKRNIFSVSTLVFIGAALAAATSLRASTDTVKSESIGAEACLACHADKAGFKDNIHAKAWPRAKKISFSESCETCHGPGSLHGRRR